MDLSIILSESLNYVSGDNCQAFRFQTHSESVIEIFYLHDLAEHRLNRNDGAESASLGSLLESIDLVAKSYHYETECELFVDNVDPEQSLQRWAVVRLKNFGYQATPDDVRLRMALKKRFTDRANYETTPILTGDVQWIREEIYHFPNLRFLFLDRLSPLHVNMLKKIEAESWMDFKFGKDVLKQIRFTRRQAELTRDGLTWNSIQMPLFKKPFLWLMARFPILYKAARLLGVSKENANLLQEKLEHSGGVGWVATKEKSLKGMVEVGRFYFRVWLHLADRGYSFQPVTLATMIPFFHRRGWLPDDWSPKARSWYDEIIQYHARIFSLDPQFEIAWAFRTGRSIQEKSESTSLRKDVKDLIIGPSA